MRATMSVVPAGVKGTTIRTGRFGQASWARAAGTARRPALAASAARRVSMGRTFSRFPAKLSSSGAAGSIHPGAGAADHRRPFLALPAYVIGEFGDGAAARPRAQLLDPFARLRFRDDGVHLRVQSL